MDSEVKTITTEAAKQKALEHAEWIEAAIRERGQIGRKKLYRMRPEWVSLLGFETALKQLREEGKITGTNILRWTAE